MKHRRIAVTWLLLACAALLSTVWAAEATVEATVDGIVTRLFATMDRDQLHALDNAAILALLTDEEKSVLATRHWRFDVDVPVVVSVMRHEEQATPPFWLEEAGFTKTDLMARNESYRYEVWQKRIDAGHVGLGINGFELHRPHYFVAVGPQDPARTPRVTNVFPANQALLEMREGSTIYHDWSELVLVEVPDALRGHVLLPTIRGRARDAHLVGAFRETEFPSSEVPDLVVLTWSDDPRTTQTIQWRTSPAVETGVARYRRRDAAANLPWEQAAAALVKVQDRLVINDRYTHHYRATLRGLEPGTPYEYTVGASDDPSTHIAPASFTTAPPAGDDPFTFIVLSDTHSNPVMRTLLRDAVSRYPGAAFCTIAGDLVGTGQYRDHWDALFAHGADFLRERPLLPTLGNHDTIDGLGAYLYLTLMGLPANGPAALEPGLAYSLRYADTLFLMLDATSPVPEQVPWLEAQLNETDARWKVAVFHFPPYSPTLDYAEIRGEWGPVFDKHNVDLVISGHVHYYLRTHPLRGGERAESPGAGTVYLITVSVPGRTREMETPDYAAVLDFSGAPLYVAITIDGDRLIGRAHDDTGAVHDEFVLER